VQALTRGARSSVPAGVYRLDSQDHPATAAPGFDQVVDLDCSPFDPMVDHEWAREKRYAGAPIDADEDMSEEAVTQPMNDGVRT